MTPYFIFCNLLKNQSIFHLKLTTLNMAKKAYKIVYEFFFKKGKSKVFQLALHPETITLLRLKTEPRKEYEWTLLKNNQCECCPLDENEHKYCPIAVNIAELVEEFKNTFSFNDCIVRCATPERTYLKKTSIQEGLFSIFGVIMATSNCPIMDFLKPMARFHLPFSTIQETIFRSTSIHLLRQYFNQKKGKPMDMNLEKLDEHYGKVQLLNKGMLARTNTVLEKSADADNNAIIILNALAQMFNVEIEENLNSIEYLFP